MAVSLRSRIRASKLVCGRDVPSGKGQFPKRHVSPKGRDNIMRWPMIACLVQVFPVVIYLLNVLSVDIFPQLRRVV